MSINQGTVANSQGGFATGVTGGMRFRIDGTNIYVYVGFCNLTLEAINSTEKYQVSRNLPVMVMRDHLITIPRTLTGQDTGSKLYKLPVPLHKWPSFIS